MNTPAGFVMRGVLAILLTLTSCLLGCGKSEEPTTSSHGHAPAKPVVFDPMSVAVDTPELIKGRDVWIATCGQCHVPGLGGAPRIGDKADWGPRIAKGKEVLYDHAINGFVGPQLNEMPPKGGFPDISDEDVKLAVDFIVLAHE